MATEAKISTIYVDKVEPSPVTMETTDKTESCDIDLSTGEVKIHVNGDLSVSSASGVSVPPLSSSSSRASGVGSPDDGSSSTSSLSLTSHDNRYASREALIEQLTSDPNRHESGPESKQVINQLLEHIVSLKMEIETLRNENEKLNSMKSTMDDEIHSLTETLFEEAYKMVDEAKGGKMSAEKQLACAAGKIDAMETEMSALKSLLTVPSSITPSTPQKHHRSPSVKRMMKKLKSKSSKKPSSSGTTSPSPPGATPLKLVEHHGDIRGETLREGDISPGDFETFQNWLDGLSTSIDHTYLDSIVETDVKPCLHFVSPELCEQVLAAVKDNHLLMEVLPSRETRQCALSGNTAVVCTHRLQLGTSEEWHYISQWCRDRIAAACDFYMYVGHIQKGIVKHSATKIYWQVRKLRAMMSLARLSLELPVD